MAADVFPHRERLAIRVGVTQRPRPSKCRLRRRASIGPSGASPAGGGRRPPVQDKSSADVAAPAEALKLLENEKLLLFERE